VFDVGFSELLVIAVVALLVLGPERLPKAARFAGLWVRRARAHWNAVKSEFESEIANEDLQRTLRDTRAALQSAQDQLRGTASELQHQLDDARAQLQALPAAAAAAAGSESDEHAHEAMDLDGLEGMGRTELTDEDLLDAPPPEEEEGDAHAQEHTEAEAPDPQQALPLPPAPPPAGAAPDHAGRDHDAGR
jgi:sec-independent protein translocase protein TatB